MRPSTRVWRTLRPRCLTAPSPRWLRPQIAQKLHRRWMLIATLLLNCAVLSFPTSAHSAAFESCTLYGTSGATRVEAECMTLARPLNPLAADPAAQPTVALRIAVVRSLAPTPAQDALTLINGGPGASSIEMYADIAPLLTGVLRERDIVIVDQRGTGQSTPLRCPEQDAMQTDASPEAVRVAAQACVANLPADPRYFTTSVAVRDLEAVREELGYDQWTLYGVSYGTRVAQHYARRYPDRLRALIIDGVVPMPDALGPNVAENAQRTLDALFKRCAESTPCAAAFPALSTEFETLKTQLETAPTTVALAHPVTGEQESLELTYGHLAVAVRLGTYAPETASLIPLQIHQAATQNNFTPIAAQALQVIEQLSSTMATGMHNSVVCAEDVPFYDFNAEQMRDRLANTYLGYEQVEALRAICSVWPTGGVVDAEFKAPLESDVPTLLLSGEFDPITPPTNADAVAEGLSNARHLVARGQGHAVLARGCMPQLLRRFIETPDPDALDTECLELLQPDPFFIDLMGPAR